MNVGVAGAIAASRCTSPNLLDLAAVFCGELNLTTDAYAATHDAQWLRPPEARQAQSPRPRREFPTERKYLHLLPAPVPSVLVLL